MNTNMEKKEIIVEIEPNIRYLARKIWAQNKFAYFPVLQKKVFLFGWIAFERVELDGWNNIYGLDAHEAQELGEKVKRRYLEK